MDEFNTIYRAHASYVYQVALRMVNSTHEAEEVTQDVFVSVYRKMNDFQFRSSIKTWLYRITINTSINHLEKCRKHVDGRVNDEFVIDNQEAQSNPRELVEAKEHEVKVAKLLALLNHHERSCIVLRNFEGLSYEEIARTLEMNINTVRTHLKRARAKMLVKGKGGVGDEM